MVQAADFAKTLQLTVLSPSTQTEWDIRTTDLNRPGMQFCGFYEYFPFERPQVIGKVEMTYLENLEPEVRRQMLKKYFSFDIPCVIICRGMHPPEELLEAAAARNIAVYQTGMVTTKFFFTAINYLNRCLAPRVTRHGVLVSVYGMGVLITGDSGVGKSEAALELIRRGHQLVADDVVDICRVSDNRLTGECPEMVRHFMEIRGIGIIDIVENRLVGIVTIDDAISILQDEASEDIAKMNAIGPSDKPYFKQSMWDLYKSRAPWLLFLMISATFSSLVIRGYEDALAAVTVLTAYIPMLTDAGGNAGSQSTSTIIRGMAVGEIQPHDLPRILWRESRVALLCGATLAVCNFAKLLLFDKVTAPVALVVCLTLICTILLSQLIGGILPVAAEKLHVDPAVMASPLITTIVDATTLLIYFNVAKIVLHL